MERREQSEAANSFPKVGRWRVSALPGGWIYIANFGIKQMVTDTQRVPANVSLGEDALRSPDGLPAYIATQRDLMQYHLTQPKMAGPQPVPFQGAEEAYLFFIRHTPPNVSDELQDEATCTMLHAQSYVRVGTWVGIVTLTTPESQLSVVRPAYEAFLKGLRILPPEEPAPQW